MNPMIPRRRRARLLWTASGFCALFILFSSTVRAEPITVDATVTMNADLFRYEYSVMNNSSIDLLLVTINVPIGPVVQNVVAPIGFKSFFDPGVGAVDFAADTMQFLVGSTISGFRFDSRIGPGAATFTALGLSGSQSPLTFEGSTTAPAPAPVPEPGTLALLGTGLLYLARRRFPGNKTKARGEGAR